MVVSVSQDYEHPLGLLGSQSEYARWLYLTREAVSLFLNGEIRLQAAVSRETRERARAATFLPVPFALGDWFGDDENDWLEKRIIGADDWPDMVVKSGNVWENRTTAEQLFNDEIVFNWERTAVYKANLKLVSNRLKRAARISRSVKSEPAAARAPKPSRRVAGEVVRYAMIGRALGGGYRTLHDYRGERWLVAEKGWSAEFEGWRVDCMELQSAASELRARIIERVQSDFPGAGILWMDPEVADW